MSSNSTTTPSQRFHFVDLARGFIIICMALDHTRGLIAKAHGSESWGTALPNYEGDGAAFISRWITHLCAPGFFFLMGVSLALFTQSRRSAMASWPEIQKHFIVRGLILVLMQFTLINIAWALGSLGSQVETNNFGSGPHPGDATQPWFYFGVLASLGCSMIILPIFIKFHQAWLSLLGIAIIVLGFLFFPSDQSADIPVSIIERIIWIPGQTGIFLVRYPIVPWLGLGALGLVYGTFLTTNPNTAKIGGYIGIALLALFFISRGIFNWGDHHPLQGDTWIDFLNFTKYPPSLNYLCATLGLNLIILYLAQALKLSELKVFSPLTIFGSTTLFFYIAHLYCYGLIAYFFPLGTNLAMSYLMWVCGLAILLPACIWWRNLKRNKPKTSWVQYI